MKAVTRKRVKERSAVYAVRPQRKAGERLPFPQARHLTRNERLALQAYKNYLLRKLPHQIQRVVLFGSKARGDSTRESDVDLLVVVGGDKPKTPWGLDEPRFFTIVDCVFDFLMKYRVYLAPTVMHVEETRKSSSLLADIDREGIELWHRQAQKISK